MTPVTATFYDGKTSQPHEVHLHFDRTGRLRITGLKHDLTYPLSDVRITSRLGNTPRSIYLPGGAKCETLENDAIDANLQRWGRGRWEAVLHTLESKLGYTLLALVLTIVAVWGMLTYARFKNLGRSWHVGLSIFRGVSRILRRGQIEMMVND